MSEKEIETSEITLAMGRVYVLTELDGTRERLIGAVVHASKAKEWASKKPLARLWYECDVDTEIEDLPELGSGDEPDANAPVHFGPGYEIVIRKGTIP